MAFEATKREWGELYAFFRLLADGYVYAGTPDVEQNPQSNHQQTSNNKTQPV